MFGWEKFLQRGGRQDRFWRNYSLGGTVWWNCRQLKRISCSPHLRRMVSHGVILLKNFEKPAWGDNAGTRWLAGYEGELRADTLRKFCEQGPLRQAVEALGVLVESGSSVSQSLLYTVLKVCVAKKDLVLGRLVHTLILKLGYESDTFLCNHILRMYAAHGKLQEAMDVFTVVSEPDVYTWSSIITAHVKHGEAEQAIQLYRQMRRASVKPDSHVFVAALQACARGADLRTGQLVHADVLASAVEPHLFLGTCLVDMYAKCGSLEDAQLVFDELREKDVVTWTSLITGYSQQGLSQKALQLYSAMEKEGISVPDTVTFVSLLQACANVGATALEKGVHLHARLAKRFEVDLVVSCSLINMYAKCGSLEAAQAVFDSLHRKDIVTWNSIIAGYSQQGMGQQALHLYRAMRQEDVALPDAVTFACLLQACASLGAPGLEEGKQLHLEIEEHGLQADGFVANSLINMYSKCGSLEDARIVFNGLQLKTLVAWNSIIAGCVQQRKGEEALELYSDMRESITIPDSVTFVCLLQACASVGTSALAKGRQLHAQILEQERFQTDLFVANSLLTMYAKCGSLEDAQRLFDGLGQKSVVTWNAIIAGYSQEGMIQEAFHLYTAMQQEGVAPDSVTFLCLLQVCAARGSPALGKGKQLHSQFKQGIQADMLVTNSLVHMYTKCGSLEEAQSVFDGLSQKTVVTWNVMIAGYSQHGKGQEAIDLFRDMQEEGIHVPNSMTFVSLLQACARLGAPALENGKHVHALITEHGLEANIFVGNSLVNMYAKCCSLEDAQSVFDDLGQKDVVTWNAMIAGYSQQGMGQKALHLYSTMREEGMAVPDEATFACLLQACAGVGTPALEEGKQLHDEIVEQGLHNDLFLGNCLVNMYAKCGSLEDAQKVFDGLDQKTLVTWNALTAGYSQQGMGWEALRLYNAMQVDGIIAPDSVTFVSLLQACARVGKAALEKGKELHSQIVEAGLHGDVSVANSLVNMYGKCGSLDDAKIVFNGLGHKTLVTWNTMITGYSQQGIVQEALNLYSAMQEEGAHAPNVITFVSILKACARLGTLGLQKGKKIHVQIEEQGLQADVFVANSLVDMYAKCGSLKDAQSLFEQVGQKDVVTWNSMIAAYSQLGMGQEALDLYNSMQGGENPPPDLVTFVCLLQACASVGIPALDKGKQFHAEIEKRGFQSDVFVANSLIDMYAKCGNLEDALRVFDGLRQKDVVTWNALISGYSLHSRGQEALDVYSAMQDEGVPVDAVTLACVLQACANEAALPVGRQLHAEINKQGLQDDAFVAINLINMYAKSGTMADAQGVFDSLPRKDIVAWNALITGYTHQGDTEAVLDLLHRMAEYGVQPDGITFLSVLTVCSHAGLVKQGRHYFEAMSRQYDLTPSMEHHSCMVDLLGRAGHMAEALDVVRTMPVVPPVAIWRTLLGACQKWGNLEVGLHAFQEAVRLDEKDAAAYVLMSNIYTGAKMWEEAQEMQMRRKGIGAWKQPGQSSWTDMNGLVHTFVVGDVQGTGC